MPAVVLTSLRRDLREQASNRITDKFQRQVALRPALNFCKCIKFEIAYILYMQLLSIDVFYGGIYERKGKVNTR